MTEAVLKSEWEKQQARIAELEAVLRALAQAVREQDDAIDPSSKLMQALRDAESWI